MRRRRLALAVLLGALVSACSSDEPSTPSSPSKNTPTLISITLTGTLQVLTGQTTQLTATANYAKGTTQNISSQASWTSSNPSVATVSSGGLVTGVATGTTVIKATYQSVTGTVEVTSSRPPTYALSGAVTETAPTSTTPVENARVEIMDGANQGKFGTTDAAGQYQIPGLTAGTFTVKAHRDTYDDVTKSVNVSANTTLNFTLNPTLQQVSQTFTKQISGGDVPCYSGSPCQVFDLPLHNAGRLQATLTWTSTTDARLLLQLYNADTGVVLAQDPVTPSETGTTPRQSIAADMSSPGNYQLRVVAWRIARITQFTLTTTHTN